MDQIQQHEWDKGSFVNLKKCFHCKCVLIPAGFGYKYVRYQPYAKLGFIKKEPVCVIREIKTSENGINSET